MDEELISSIATKLNGALLGKKHQLIVNLINIERLRSWEKPDLGWAKVNTDASFHTDDSSGGGGVVIRDVDGRLLVASAKRYIHLPDALTAEAMAARDGLLLAAERGIRRVCLEMDNLTLVNLLQSREGERSVIAGFWQEIRELGRFFSGVVFKFVSREGNGAAHVCARLASETSPELVWLDDFPACLLRVIVKDCNPAVS